MKACCICVCFLFQAEDGIRYLVRSRGLGDVYKRQARHVDLAEEHLAGVNVVRVLAGRDIHRLRAQEGICLLYTSDAADERSSVDLGGRRIIKKKKQLELADGCYNKTNGIVQECRGNTHVTVKEQSMS